MQTDERTDAVTEQAQGPTPGDPVQRDLAQVAEAVAAARVGVATLTDPPAVPSEEEVASLERAHETLRTTLDRVDRGG